MVDCDYCDFEYNLTTVIVTTDLGDSYDGHDLDLVLLTKHGYSTPPRKTIAAQ